MNANTLESATEGQCISGWFCATTKIGKEQTLAGALEGVGIESYVPLEITRTWRRTTAFNPLKGYRETVDKRVEKSQAWFPGYLFARMDERAWAIAKTQLRRLVGAKILPRWVDLGTGTPIRIDDEVVALLREGRSAPQRIRPEFRPGDKLDIISGPFAGHEAIYSDDANERIYALINLLGRQKIVPFYTYEVRAAAIA